MSSLLHRLGRFAFRRPGRVLAGTLALIAAVLALAVIGGGSLTTASSIPGSPAQRTLDTMDRHFPSPDLAGAQLVFRAPPGQSLQTPATRRAIAQTLAAARRLPAVASVGDGQTSTNGRTFVTGVDFRVQADTDVPQPALDALTATGAPARAAGLEVIFGGDAFVAGSPPVGPMEGVGVLVALVVLVLTFGSLLAAGMPLLTALIGIAISLAGTLGFSSVVGIPDTALTLSLMIGLAVGIDYALFIVSRHRTQLARGMPVGDSIARANASAGSAVVFAGLTVVIALAGLSVARIPMLTGMGLSAAGAVAVAMLLAVAFVPALLAFAGERLVPKPGSRAARRLAAATGDEPRTLGAAWTRRVIARPRVAVAAVVVVLGAMAEIGGAPSCSCRRLSIG